MICLNKCEGIFWEFKIYFLNINIFIKCGKVFLFLMIYWFFFIMVELIFFIVVVVVFKLLFL